MLYKTEPPFQYLDRLAILWMCGIAHQENSSICLPEMFHNGTEHLAVYFIVYWVIRKKLKKWLYAAACACAEWFRWVPQILPTSLPHSYTHVSASLFNKQPAGQMRTTYNILPPSSDQLKLNIVQRFFFVLSYFTWPSKNPEIFPFGPLGTWVE